MNDLKGIGRWSYSDQGSWEVGLFSHRSYLLYSSHAKQG
jgi:hypothetical protein